jgi:hypothetical protein
MWDTWKKWHQHSLVLPSMSIEHTHIETQITRLCCICFEEMLQAHSIYTCFTCCTSASHMFHKGVAYVPCSYMNKWCLGSCNASAKCKPNTWGVTALPPYTTTPQRYRNTNLCYYRLEKVLLALLVTYLFMCSYWPCYCRLVYCNTSACLQEHLSSVTIIFAVTLFSALVTLGIMVERIVCNTFIYLSKHLSIVTRIVCCNTFLFLVTLLHYGRA